MKIIQQISSYTFQKQTLVLPDGTSIQLTIQFKPMQYGWFITELIYGSFILQGSRICISPNLLHQFRNQIPFGLACFSSQNREPTLIDDFSSGNANLYILDQDEVNEFSRFLSE